MQRHTRWSAAAATIVVALAGFTGTAAAGGGHGNASDQGSPARASESHGSPSAGAQDQPRASKHDEHSQTQPAHGSAKPQESKHTAADGSKRYGNGQSALEIAKRNAPTITSLSQLSGPGNSGLHKVTICHKTGSGYVEITVDVHALEKGHTEAKGDIIPAPAEGCPATSSETSKPPEQTPGNSREHKVTICHETGSGYVEITVDEHALEKGHTEAKGDIIPAPAAGCPTTTKTSNQSEQTVTFCDMSSATTGELETKPVSEVLSHELNGTPEEARDIVPSFTVGSQTYSQGWDTNGQAIWNAGCNLAPASEAASAKTSTPVTPAAPTAPTSGTAGAQATPPTPTAAPPAPTGAVAAPPTTPPSSGVAGATHTRRSPSTKPSASGVAGASHTLRSPSTSPSSGVFGTSLPFTGFPLWVAVLAGLAVLGMGVAISRAGASSRR